MNRILTILILIIFSISGFAQNDSLCKSITTQSVDWLRNGEAEKLNVYFTEKVASKLDVKTTASIWQQISSQYGRFDKIDTVYSKEILPNLVVDCILSFKEGNLKYRLTFNKENKIAGIFFIPYKRKKAKEREPQESSEFFEKKYAFKNQGFEFPAMFCYPKNHEIIATVVFVHGSGPNDMDETIGPNKMFLELAHELAKNGIASLRYDKRTYIAKQTGNTKGLKTDIDNVVVNDAVKAIEEVKKNKKLQELKVFVIGHSLGANLSPRIAQKSGELDGIILMAGNSRPLEDLVVEQYEYLYARGCISKAEKAEIKKIKKQAKNVKRLEKDLRKNPDMELNLPLTNDTAFWLSLTQYNPIETAKSISTPMLILQGSRDYQVTRDDFENWRKALGSRSKTNYIFYSNLNHLFIKGKEKSYPEEYNRKGNISPVVITDISKWIDGVIKNEFSHETLVH